MLRFDGIATLAEVFLNGELVARERVDVRRPRGRRRRACCAASNELAIRCRALAPAAGASAARPRARWRTRLVADGNLRLFRTMLLGRAPGFAPGPAAVGPWRPVWLERRRGLAVDELRAAPAARRRRRGPRGPARLRALDGRRPDAVEVELAGRRDARGALALADEDGGTVAEGELEVPARRALVAAHPRRAGAARGAAARSGATASR